VALLILKLFYVEACFPQRDQLETGVVPFNSYYVQ